MPAHPPAVVGFVVPVVGFVAVVDVGVVVGAAVTLLVAGPPVGVAVVVGLPVVGFVVLIVLDPEPESVVIVGASVVAGAALVVTSVVEPVLLC